MSDAVCRWCGRPGWSDTGTCEEYVQTAKCPGRDDSCGLAREPTPSPKSDDGYPVDSVIGPDVCVCCGVADQPRLNGGRVCLDAEACVKRRGRRDADLRALAELRAMGPARLLTLLRRAYDTSPSDLFDLLHQHWGSPAPSSGLAGLGERETQAAPVASSERPIWEMVIEEAEGRWAARGNCDPMRVEILSDMRARHAEGVRKYGVPLQASNGRDPLRDAYEEALDRVVYLRQAVERGHAVQDLYSRALNDLVAHKATMRVAECPHHTRSEPDCTECPNPQAQAEERFRAFDREMSQRMEEMRRSGR